MRPSCRPLRDPSLRIAGLTALSAGLLACSATTRPGDALDGAAGIDSQDSGGAADVRPAPDGGSSAADATAPGHATPSSATDATASSDGSEDTTVPPADAADATTVADAAEAGLQQLSDAGPASAMATAYLNNPAHTSAALDPSLAPPLAAIWSFATPSVELSISYPLIAGGRVYFVYGSTATNAAAQLTAVDEHTGAPIWGPVDLVADGIAGQAYDGEQVFTVDSTGVVRSFDAATGAPGWTTTLSSSPGPPTAYKGLLYVANAGTLTALDEATGQVTWTATLGYGIGATSPAVTDDGVFVSAACGDLSAFDRTAGSVLWHHLSTCGAFAGQPMVFDGRVYLEESEPEAQVDIFDVGSGGLLASLPCFIPPAFDPQRVPDVEVVHPHERHRLPSVGEAVAPHLEVGLQAEGRARHRRHVRAERGRLDVLGRDRGRGREEGSRRRVLADGGPRGRLRRELARDALVEVFA